MVAIEPDLARGHIGTTQELQKRKKARKTRSSGTTTLDLDASQWLKGLCWKPRLDERKKHCDISLTSALVARHQLARPAFSGGYGTYSTLIPERLLSGSARLALVNGNSLTLDERC